MITIYGIKNCDSIRKARKWLETHNIEHRFHDFRSDGLTRKQLKSWVKQLGWEVMVNKRGTTWRKLPENTREALDEAGAIELMLDQPTLIKRPLLDNDGSYMIGFNEKIYQQVFQ